MWQVTKVSEISGSQRMKYKLRRSLALVNAFNYNQERIFGKSGVNSLQSWNRKLYETISSFFHIFLTYVTD